MTDSSPFPNDLDLLLLDWGRPIVLRTVSTTVDPFTGIATETITDHLLTAIVGPIESEAVHRRSLVARRDRVSILTRADDLSDPLPNHRARVSIDGTDYRVSTVERSADGSAVRFDCERV